MAAFDDIVNGTTDLQAAAFLNQIVGGFRERQQAVDLSPTFPVFANGTDTQAAATWSSLQSGVEALVPSYVNHNATIVGQDYYYTTGLPMFDLAAWRSAAGLPSAGFRRVTGTTWPADWKTNNANPAFSYGYMQEGDVIGPWVFQDLQRALSALKWTKRLQLNAGSADGKYKQSAGFADYPETCDDARNAAISAWASAPVQDQIGTGWLYLSYAWAFPYLDGDTDWTCERDWGKPHITGVPTFLPCSYDSYGYPESGDGQEGTFVDVDGLGMSWHKLFLMSSTATPDSNATKTGAIFEPAPKDWATEPSPIVDSGLSCGQMPPYPDYAFVMISVNDPYWVMKWSFTNA